MKNLDKNFDRIEYFQIGLTSNNTLKAIDINSNVLVCVGDFLGSVNCFLIKNSNLNVPDTLFKTLPNANSKINCLEIIDSDSKSPKFLVSFGSIAIRGYNKKGKQFFGIELNNLTEPIKHLKTFWPNEIFVAGQFIYNHYKLYSDDVTKSTSIKNSNFYICPGKINFLYILDNKINDKTVTLLACEDRLLRIIFDSNCEFEVETIDICNVLSKISNYQNFKKENNFFHYFIYGTSNGKISMLKLNFENSQVKAEHLWEINLMQSKSAICCITPTIDFYLNKKHQNNFNINEASEFIIGRADGSIEIFQFENYIDELGEETINLDKIPKLTYEYNCGERLTSITSCKLGSLIICCTFTGIIFGINRNLINTKTNLIEEENPYQFTIEKNCAIRIEELQNECDYLEEKLKKERENYQKITSDVKKKKKIFSSEKTNDTNVVSALPYFTINDSFVLLDNASYLLTIECEAPIDCVVFQSEIPLKFVDCERNSAVVSLNDNKHASFINNKIPNNSLSNKNQILATFRCQANTTRLEIKVSSIEGEFGQLKTYILTKVTPKSCQVRNYYVKALSLHKIKYYNKQLDNEEIKKEKPNIFTIIGQFSLNEAYSWLYLCLPELKDKTNLNNKQEFVFESTLVKTYLKVKILENQLHFESDNVSTISILKDFLTREATKRSIKIEIKLELNKFTIHRVLNTIYDKLRALIKYKKIAHLKEAVYDIETIDKEISKKMLIELEEDEKKLSELNLEEDKNEIERFYGLITDLFIDYEKLKGNDTKSMMNLFKSKFNDMIAFTEKYIEDEFNFDIFLEKIIKFWQI